MNPVQSTYPGPKTETWYDDGTMRLVVRRELTSRAETLLEETTWGTEGLRYQMEGFAERRSRHPDPRALYLYEDAQLRGVQDLSHHTLRVEQTNVDAIYRGTLAIDPHANNKNLGELLVDHTARRLLDNATGPTLLYGYHQANNSRSQAICERAGYRILAEFRAYPWSRRFPRDHNKVRRLVDADSMRATLREAYQGHSLVDLDNSFLPARTWVFVRKGEVTASVQATLRTWRIAGFPSGSRGERLLTWIPRLRLLGSTLRHGLLPHVLLGNITCNVGRERDLVRTVEAVMARNNVHVALTMADPRCPIHRRIQAKEPFGWIYQTLGASRLHVMADYRGLTSTTWRQLTDSPVWVNPVLAA
jgi:GNAT superfamily N-acetyltransferase